MFEGVTCGNLPTSNYSISKHLHVLEKHYTCPNDMELHNLTTSDEINYTQYCINFFLPRFLAYYL